MHPALMIAVMEERDRELARRTRDAWRRPAPRKRSRSRSPSQQARRGHGRLYAALSRSLAFFS